ncbi:hypothetical protein IV500_05000 [Paeniglutamicibacter antarcticus]|uniref:Uncharacterized protein n=1 Tax=Arthrobacter terrae TaxID=2935737 RepID=A0A931G3K8_9MICC|nr:hypothetical protein [Arthrobacter terrae]MBG0738776.1 hypothetical protein [Arthrobacter terrae]
MRSNHIQPIGFPLDNTFDMDFFTSGHDEEGRPALEVNLYALIVNGPHDEDGSAPASIDKDRRTGQMTVTWESMGIYGEKLEAAKALEGWYTVSGDGLGVTAHALEETFGPSVALVILQAMMAALANEQDGVDVEGRSYRLSGGVSAAALDVAIEVTTDLADRVLRQADIDIAFWEIVGGAAG